MRSQRVDLNAGMLNENRLKKYFQSKNLNIRKYKNKYHWCDFCDITNKYAIEIKKRNIYKNTYPTTIIGKDKIDEYKKDKRYKDFLFLFSFKDGDYYCLLSEIKDIVYEPFRRHQRSDFNDKRKLYLHININSLKPLENIY